MKIISKVFHGFTIIGALVAFVSFILTLTASNGAPQEAAGAAMSLCFVIIPYCFARAVDGIIGIDKLMEKKIKQYDGPPLAMINEQNKQV